MEASELRIGNLINYINKPVICNIDIIYAVSKCIRPTILYNPIPLTEEWLLKLGFKKTNKTQNPSYYIGRDDKKSWNSFRIQYSTIIDINTMIETNGFIGLYLCNKYWCTIRYVHQLQNLYFALTEQELTLKENE